jgi:SAM-dependent methyltransferase
MIRTMSRLYKLLKLKQIRNPSLLDYGSGGGRWSQAAAQAGFHVCAYEPVGNRSAAVHESGSLIVVNNINDLQDQKFDLINLEQVLEHIISPLDTLESLRTVCHAKTLIRITVPNLTRYAGDLWESFPFDGRRIHILSPYDHLHGFSARSLDELLSRAGYIRILRAAVWLTHPVYMGRYIAGRLFSKLGMTTALARHGYDKGEKG